MTMPIQERGRYRIEPSLSVAAIVLAVITLIRLVGLIASDVDFFTDESQYWSWSRELAWGYSSKPPLLPWIIHAAEFVCGSGEACIRAPSPIFYFCTCLIIYFAAQSLYGAVVGFWAAVLMIFGTGLVFSSRIISTDVPLLFFWALALLAYIKLLERSDLRWAILLGLSLGMGLLAKYAMGYFLLGMLLATVFDRRSQALLRSRSVWLAFGIAAIIVAPNMIWVFNHGFSTFRSVAESAGVGEGFRFHPVRALEFLAAQFGVFGPVVFGVLLLEISKLRSPEEIPASRIMLAFAIPPLAVITLIAMFSRAYANWAATSIVSSTILAAALIVHRKAWGWLAFSIALGVAVQGALLYGDSAASRLAIPLLPAEKSEIYSRTLGFRNLANQLEPFVLQTGADTIAGEDRRTIAALLYYRRAEPQRVLAWPSPDVRQFLATRALTEAAGGPILFVTECPFPQRLKNAYAEVAHLGDLHVPAGPTLRRYYAVFSLSGAKGPLAALPECADE